MDRATHERAVQEAVQEAREEERAIAAADRYKVFLQQRELFKLCFMPCRVTEYVFVRPSGS